MNSKSVTTRGRDFMIDQLSSDLEQGPQDKKGRSMSSNTAWSFRFNFDDESLDGACKITRINEFQNSEGSTVEPESSKDFQVIYDHSDDTSPRKNPSYDKVTNLNRRIQQNKFTNHRKTRNREAAREYRKRSKAYLENLKSEINFLEKENNMLIEEINHFTLGEGSIRLPNATKCMGY